MNMVVLEGYGNHAGPGNMGETRTYVSDIFY